MLEFRILGPLEVRRDGRVLDIGGPRSCGLLAALIVHAGEAVPADVLAQAVWGDEATRSATKALQVQVSRLRRALGPAAERVQTVGGGYRLRVEPGEIDADRFEHACRRAGELAAREAAAVLREALALWTGPALADVRYEPWAQSEIRRLEELRAVALEERVTADLALGDDARLVGELGALVTEYPLRERIRGQQMLALYRAGRHADALAAFRDARMALDAELGLEPGPELRALEQAILMHDPALAAPARAEVGVPPAPPTPTFGRDEDVAEVLRLLDTTRLLTLTGPGGVGKTRLATEVARAAGGRFVALAATADAERIPALACDALAVARIPGETDAEALHRVLDGGPVLLVFDNLEHLPEAATLLAALLERHRGLRLLVTSRQPVGVRAERLYPVAPLVAGPDAALFADRARAHDPAFALTDANGPAIRAICDRLAGLPLAIELAAARLGVLTPADLAGRLSAAVDVLERGPRDAPPRQRTLRATLDWSFDLLDVEEQDAFTALGAFAGGCDLEAAETVAQTELSVLEALVAKSLVSAQEGRLTLLEPVRQYAAERLGARPDADAVYTRHLAHYTRLAERCEGTIWVRRRMCPEFTMLSREHDNFSAAVTRAVRRGDAHGALELISALGSYMWNRHHTTELHDWWEQAFANAGPDIPPRLRARSLLASGNTPSETPGYDARVREALSLFRSLGDDAMSARCLVLLSAWSTFAGHYAQARATSEEALVHAMRSGDDALIGEAQAGIALASSHVEADLPLARRAVTRLRTAGAEQRALEVLATLSFAALDEDAYELSADLAREALAGALALGDAWTLAFVNGNLGLATLLGGSHDVARAAFRDELVLARANALGMFLFEGLLGLAALAATAGEDHRAATLDAASGALAERPIAGSEMLVYQRVQERFIGPARDRLGGDAWEGASATGREMTADVAVAFALEPTPVAAERGHR